MQVEKFFERMQLKQEENPELVRFIKNWMPESNYDYQQYYFLNNLELAIKGI